MSVDLYAPCPCGSGKKVKFCKCSESVDQLDRVMKMIEGGQIVPALDRLSSVLEEHPDAAWALAIRGRLLLDLKEFEALAENADRFIRLQPSNPLALTQRSAAHLFRGDQEAAVEALLEALTESGREVDSFVIDVAAVLAYSLLHSGVVLTARAYASLAASTTGYEGGQTATQVLRQIDGSPMINLLAKEIPEPIERPAAVEWGERYDEAAGLLRNNKVELAQSKFESLQRSVPGEPAVLSGLLNCAIWRGDVSGQHESFRKLSQCESLDEETRVRFRAKAALVQPETPEIAVETIEFDADLEDAEQVELAMTADSRFLAVPSDMLRQFGAGRGGNQQDDNEVPPRSGFQIIDREAPPEGELPPVDAIPEALGLVLVYGKQTDRPARLETYDVLKRNADDIRERLSAAVGQAELRERIGGGLPFVVNCEPSVAMVRYRAQPGEAEALQAELSVRRMPERVVSLPLPILGGVSLAEAADDEGKRFERTAVMRVIEGYDGIVAKGDEVVARIFVLAKLDPPPTLRPTDDQIEDIANEDLNRVDPAQLGPRHLVYLLQRAQSISATPAIRAAAHKLLDAELPEELKSASLLAYMALANKSERADEALDWIEKGKQFAATHELPAAGLLLSEISFRLRAGDGAGFQAAINTLTTQHRDDPEVMFQLQQLLTAYGLIRPDGRPASMPAESGAAESAAGMGGAAPGVAGPAASPGIWTPDSGTPASGPQQPSEQGGSGKLWIPGMD